MLFESIFLFSMAIINVSTYSNELIDVFCDNSSETECMLEFGSINVAFSDKPMIIENKHSDSYESECIELFCHKSFTTKKIMQKISSLADRGYDIRIDAVNDGLKLVLHYDPQKVYINYDEFVDYGSSVNFVIRFYNQDVLSKLHNHAVPMLRLA